MQRLYDVIIGMRTILSCCIQFGTAFVATWTLVALQSLHCAASEIHVAAAEGDLTMVVSLLSANPDLVNGVTSVDESTPLHEAARNGNLEVVRILIASNANVNAITTSGLTALKLAKGYGKADVARFLQANGAKVLEPVVPPSSWPVESMADYASLPPRSGWLRGDKQLEIINSGGAMVTVRVMLGGFGADLQIPPGGARRSAWVPNGTLNVFYIFADDPWTVYQGDNIRISRNTSYTSVHLNAGHGNYQIRRLN